MTAPRKGTNLTARMRAYELYATGMKKADIARELGLTKAAIGQWAKAERWDARLADIVSQANSAADHALGDQLAASFLRLKEQALKRVSELELLCGPAQHPSTRLKAIQLWLKLAGLDRAMPNPITPGSNPNELRLVEDLLEKD